MRKSSFTVQGQFEVGSVARPCAANFSTYMTPRIARSSINAASDILASCGYLHGALIRALQEKSWRGKITLTVSANPSKRLVTTLMVCDVQLYGDLTKESFVEAVAWLDWKLSVIHSAAQKHTFNVVIVIKK